MPRQPLVWPWSQLAVRRDVLLALCAAVAIAGCSAPTAAPPAPTAAPPAATRAAAPTSAAASTNAPAPATATVQTSLGQSSTGPPKEASGRLPTGEFFLGQAEAPVTLDEWGDFQ